MNNNKDNILVEVSRDGMSAFLILIKDEEEADFKYDYVIGKVKKIVKYGLDELAIKEMIGDERYCEKICIAEGISPKNGQDGYIKKYFSMKENLIPKIKEDGSVDYKNLEIVNNINEGDILAKLIPPTEGEYGQKVTGELIPPRSGKTPFFKCGKNVKVSDDGTQLIAMKNGYVNIIGGRINVDEIFEVSAVDTSTGNINFTGAIKVRENVMSGFEINAMGNIEIDGAVEAAIINSGGDILIKRGIQGYNKGKITSKGNINIKFIENSNISCGRNLTAEAIMHSEVVSKGSINVIGKKGLLVGGTCRAKNEIQAKTVGSSMATATILEVGVDPDIKSKYEFTKNKIENIEDNLNKINKSLIILERLNSMNQLDSNKKKIYEKLLIARDSLSGELLNLKIKYTETQNYINDLSKGAIKVEGTVYPGVKIIMGNSIMYVREEISHCTFHRIEGEIKVGPF